MKYLENEDDNGLKPLLDKLNKAYDDFVKKSSVIHYSREALGAVHTLIEEFAKSEGLTAHANSIAVRFEEEI